MIYRQPELPYAYDALEPYIDAQTMEIHYSKHHAAYVANLNRALEGVPLEGSWPVEELLRKINTLAEDRRQAVINNGGGHANHSLFWKVMGPGRGGKPGGELAEAINSQIGGFNALKDKLSSAATTRFGSGWAWLSLAADGRLLVYSTPNQDSPLLLGHTPILGLDVWEHAYYLKYQNRRPDYVNAWWNVVNWEQVAEIYAEAQKDLKLSLKT